MRNLLVLAGAICLLAAPSALAADVHWNEAAKVDGKAVMRYEVTSITIGKQSWSAHISFSNLSKTSIKVGSQFAIAFYADRKTETVAGALGVAIATKFSTSLPKTLKPGASWSGVISGSGNLTAVGKVYARVLFGPFTGLPGESAAVAWITDHSFILGAGSITPPDTSGNATVI